MLVLREADILRLLSMKEAIRLVREAFAGLAAGTAINQTRRRLVLSNGAALHSMGGAFGGYFGTKIYSTHVKHGAHFLVLLYEAATARPLATIEASHLGQIRTGAATGVATDLLADAHASTVGVIGTGFQARTQIEAVLRVRQIREVKVWSRSQQRRERFAAECSVAFGASIVAADSAREAIAGAEIVVTATYAKDPVVESAWIGDGAHVNAVGSNNSQRRELPPELIARAGLIAVDSVEQARIESGDLLLAWMPEDWETDRLVELQEVVAGRRARTSAAEITLFKSNGLGVQDVAVAGYLYENYS